MHIITLQDLAPGEKATVRALCVPGGIRRRLLDLGLVSGASVTCLFRAPSGSPGAYLIKGSVIALRKDDSEKIRVASDEKTGHHSLYPEGQTI